MTRRGKSRLSGPEVNAGRRGSHDYVEFTALGLAQDEGCKWLLAESIICSHDTSTDVAVQSNLRSNHTHTHVKI